MSGYGIVGYSIFVQKNFLAAIGAQIGVAGIIGAITASVDYTSPFILIPYVAFPILNIAMGVVTLRSKS